MNIVGYDGQSYYCRRCGKAGFQSEASARGHQSYCPAREEKRVVITPINKVVDGQVERKQDFYTNTELGTNLEMSAEMSNMNSEMAGRILKAILDEIRRYNQVFMSELHQLGQRVSRIEYQLTNEIPHQLAQVQQPVGLWGRICGFIEKNPVVVLFAIGGAFILGMIIMEGSSDLSNPTSRQRRRKSNRQSYREYIGKQATGALTRGIIYKGVNALARGWR